MPSRGTLLQGSTGHRPRPHWRIATAIVGGTAVGVAAIYLFTGNDRAALYAGSVAGVISLSLVVVTGYTARSPWPNSRSPASPAYILSTFAASSGIPFPIAPIMSALRRRGRRRGDRHPGPARARPHARRRALTLAAALKPSRREQLHRRWVMRAGGPGAPLFGLNSGRSGSHIPRPAFGLLCLVVLVLVALGVARLRTVPRHSHAGRAGGRAFGRGSGVDGVRVKLIGFAIGAFIAGLGGS